MPHHMFSPIVAFYIKLTFGSITAFVALIADSIPDLSGWEKLGTNVLLMGALWFVVKLLLKEQAERKAENAAREATLIAHIASSTDIQTQLLNATKEQTGYFQTVTRNIVAERLGERKDIHEIAEKLP